MFEIDEKTNKLQFSHNPFSMPQGEMDSLVKIKTLLEIKAYQYDIVCNGVELSSGAIRNHKPDIMYKAFEIAGYKKEDLGKKIFRYVKCIKIWSTTSWGKCSRY